MNAEFVTVGACSAPRRRKSSPYLRRLAKFGEDLILCPYVPHSWWHDLGRSRMVKRLEAKGFPNMWGWLFVTVTINPDGYESPDAAYEAGSDRLRRMIHALREAGYGIKRWFWKLELHENEFPHWHLGLDCREFISNEEVSEAWGLGFTKTLRVQKERDFRYLFKYVTKAGDAVPDWVLDYGRRIRVFQTSRGFYAAQSPSRPADAEGEVGVECVETLRDKFFKWERRGVLRGRAVSYWGGAVDLLAHYVDTFISLCAQGHRALDAYHISLNSETIQDYIKPWQPKLNPPPSKPKQTPQSIVRCPWEATSSASSPSTRIATSS